MAEGDAEEPLRLDDGEMRKQWEVLNNFLTQRAVQTLIFFQKESRDRVTAGWIERFLDHDGLERFHGIRGMKTEWTEYLIEMYDTDMEEIVVSLKKRGNGQGGWSKNNPYLQARWFNYTVDIVPRDLAERLLELRKALSEEWMTDLHDIEAVLQKNHFRALHATKVNGSAFEEAQRRLQYAPLEGRDFDDTDSTPFRRGNFDLLSRLSAQQAVILVMNKLRRTATPQANFHLHFLEPFYDMWADRFDGDGPYGIGEAFLRDLADDIPKRLRMTRSQDAPIIYDPSYVAERIMYEQRQIIQAWHMVLERVPEDNAHTRRLALERRLLRPEAVQKQRRVLVDDPFDDDE